MASSVKLLTYKVQSKYIFKNVVEVYLCDFFLPMELDEL